MKPNFEQYYTSKIPLQRKAIPVNKNIKEVARLS